MNKNRVWIKTLILVVGSVLLLLGDHLTKLLAIRHLKDQNPFVLWKGVFEFRYHENRGAAFGILQGKQLFLFIVTSLILLAILYAWYRMPLQKRYHWMRFCLLLLVGGALGNMVDRLSQGYVVDFLYFSLINFPIFNVADCYVTVAAVLLAILILFYYTKEDDFDFLKLKKKQETKDAV